MSAEYGADQIQILEGLEAVRKRPGMYIGSTSLKGLHHLVYEIVDNSVDEALAGECSHIEVFINEDNSITVVDDGRGIPVGINKKSGLPAVQVVFTVLHAGGKFGGGGYKVSGGLHGVGASVVNALSKWLEVLVETDGKAYKQRYERGKVVTELKELGATDRHGTTVTFLPDEEIFEDTVFDYATIKQRLREMAFLTKGLRISLTDKREEGKKTDSFHYEGGIMEYVSYLNKNQTVLYDKIIYCEGKKGTVQVEVALQHNDGYNEGCYSFVNNINTPEGGTHLTGFRNALTKTFNEYAKLMKLVKENDPALTGEDIREGMTAIVSIKIPEPQFEGQTKQKLGNSEARGAVESIAGEQIMIFLEQNPAVGKMIVEKALLAQRARDAARKARDLTRRKTALEYMNLPGKLADCSDKNPDNCEIYLVEGDSAGGIVECLVEGLPAGIGEPVFDKLDASLAKAVMSIGAVKAVEIGDGVAVSKSLGSENNDPFFLREEAEKSSSACLEEKEEQVDRFARSGQLSQPGRFARSGQLSQLGRSSQFGEGTDSLTGGLQKSSNHSGGILGGMSDGSRILLRASFKPTPSISGEQRTVNEAGEEISIAIKGRHDPTVVERANVVVEAMTALTVLDAMLENLSARLDYVKRAYQK